MHVDLAFRLQGAEPIPADHGYVLYAAMSHLIPEVHQENGIGIHPIRRRPIGGRKLMLMPWSTLTIRVQDDQIGSLLKLAGKPLHLDSATVQVGVPEVRAHLAINVHTDRLVVIKVAHAGAGELTPANFTVAARKKMNDLGIGVDATMNVGKRRSLGMKQREIVGYEVFVEGLTAAESIALQEGGLGGKHHMGCGVFVAVRDREGR